MKDKDRTKNELINELVEMRQRINELEKSGADHKELEEALQKKTHDLGERTKELNYLYGISNLVQRQNLSLKEIFQEIVNLIPPSWQYPEIACARIILEDQIFKTKNYKETIWKQSAGITVYGNQVGTLELCYLEEKPKSYEGPFLKKEGSLINAIAERLGKVIERKKAEEELVRLSNAMKISTDSIVISDLDAKIIDVNKSTLKMYGTDDRRELIGKNSLDFIAPEDREKAFARIQEVLEKGYVKGREYHIITKEGGRILVEMSVALMKDADDKPVGFVGVSRDITRRKRAEMALKSERKHLEALFQSVRQGIATADLNHKIIDVNRSFTEMFGYTLEEIKGKDIDQIIVPREKLSEAIRITQQYDEGKISTVETVRKRKDGSLIPVEITGASIIIDSKQIGVYGIYKDITERKKTHEELQGTLKKLRRALGATIQAMALTVETRDAYTAGHQQRMTDLGRAIAKEMKLSKDQIDGIRMAGTIHDIGKIGVPAEILNKPTRLADIEFNLIKIHPLVGYNILKQIEFPWPVAEIVLQHHERMNGSGYPHGLSGEDILLEARMLGVADVVEAMASHRPYRPALGIDKALEEISKNRGTLYDSQVVDACVKLFREKEFKFKTK